MTSPKRLAGIYIRISLDPTGARLGVTRQLKDCRAKGETLGWSIHKVYEDNDTSASGTKPRPAYQRLLADLEAGTIDAVIVWDLDRLTRRPIEVEHFIELADRRKIALASVGGDVDLSTDNGRMFARIKGAVARAEVDRKSARQRSANDQRAEHGRPAAGRRSFGYSPDGMHLVPAEAAHIQDAAARLLAGESIHAITAHLNKDGALTTAGNQWGTTEVRRMLANPRYAAKRVHRGAVVGEGTWPAILDPDTHQAIRAILDDPARKAPGRPQSSLLTGIAACAVCSDRIYATRSGAKARRYYCRSRAHVSRVADPIDAYAVGYLLDLISSRRNDLLGDAADESRGRQLRAQETQLRGRLDGLAEAYAAGDLDDLQLRAGSRRAKAELDQVITELASLRRKPALASLVAADDVRAEWEGMSLDAQRAALRAALVVTLHPAGQGARYFDPGTITVESSNASEPT